ncbi:hypothetical protein AAMO2058_000209700 [Amorphochlora amoebiformis]
MQNPGPPGDDQDTPVGRKRSRKEFEGEAKIDTEDMEVGVAASSRVEVCHILGDLSSHECSISRGRIRQPVFSCLTCYPNGGCGVCLACSLTCHENHTIEEVFTKRDFQCACGCQPAPTTTSSTGCDERTPGKYSEMITGGSRQPGDSGDSGGFRDTGCSRDSGGMKEEQRSPGFVRCSIVRDEKDRTRENPNSYNHNFVGRYCTCDRPYPDPDWDKSAEEGEMHQCIVCEDWFHVGCMGDTRPGDYEAWDEMACASCSVRHKFLHYYALPSKAQSNSPPRLRPMECRYRDINIKTSPSKSLDAKKRECGKDLPLASSSQGGELASSSEGGRLASGSERGRYLFFDLDWRERLCRCSGCEQMRKDQKVSFLADPEDSVWAFEARGQVAAEKAQENLTPIRTANQCDQDEDTSSAGDSGSLRMNEASEVIMRALSDCIPVIQSGIDAVRTREVALRVGALNNAFTDFWARAIETTGEPPSLSEVQRFLSEFKETCSS